MNAYFKNLSDKRDKICFSTVGDNPISVTYEEYFHDVFNCLEKIKLSCPEVAGKHIGLLADNSYEYLVTLQAVFLGKAFVVPINSYETKDNIEYIIEHSDLDVLIVSTRFAGYHSKITLNLSDIVTGENIGDFDYDECLGSFTCESELLIYTSGTTGRSKGVRLLHSRLINMVEDNYAFYSELSSIIKKMYITVPLYHIFGLYYWIMAIRTGCVLYLNANPGSMLDEIKEIQPDLIVATPAFVNLLQKSVKKQSAWIKQLKYVICGGAVLSKELISDLERNGIACLNVYGMSETGGSGTFNLDNIGHNDSIGIPTTKTEVRIIDGEICIACASMMLGYYKDDAATAECMIDGYIHTGDLGYIADDGYVYITGRKKNLIILSGGENVSPEELETLAYKNPEVLECKVVGKNDRLYLEVFSEEKSRDGIREYVGELNKKLPVFKRIYGIEFRDSEFEKTANGKIKR